MQKLASSYGILTNYEIDSKKVHTVQLFLIQWSIVFLYVWLVLNYNNILKHGFENIPLFWEWKW